jgi:protein ImuB
MPVVLTRMERQAEIVAACCGFASRLGIHTGMTLAHARGLLPSRKSCIEVIDDYGVSISLRRLVVATMRWVPVVAVDGSDGLLCDASGCERLYGDIGKLVRRIAMRMKGWGLAARVAAAPSYGAAWAMARFGEQAVLSGDGWRKALDDLPLAALRLDALAVDELRRVGLERIGQLRQVPRPAIADRYGHPVLRRLDQALGHSPESITPIRPRPPIRVERAFDGPTDRLEGIMLAARRLVTDIAGKLLTAESGCRLLEVSLDRSDLPPLLLTIRTAKPTREARHLWSLLAPRLEGANLGYGVQGLTMHAKGLARLEHVQAEHWNSRRSADHEARIGQLVDTLNARLGVGSVLELRANESHLPESAFSRDALVTLPEPEAEHPLLIDAGRPSLLFDEPMPITVTLLMPNGPIAMVHHGGRAIRVARGAGPERLEAEWWRPATRQDTRDYFKIATEDGCVLWIFRATGESGVSAWFLHGQWA